mmetsp:Transcript_15780/g.34560  ORF Transcript_15780/g.34560 Transcript_15780/m.34560 type:complete len:214 (+) Transcript_15780:231-872(+)
MEDQSVGRRNELWNMHISEHIGGWHILETRFALQQVAESTTEFMMVTISSFLVIVFVLTKSADQECGIIVFIVVVVTVIGVNHKTVQRIKDWVGIVTRRNVVVVVLVTVVDGVVVIVIALLLIKCTNVKNRHRTVFIRSILLVVHERKLLLLLLLLLSLQIFVLWCMILLQVLFSIIGASRLREGESNIVTFQRQVSSPIVTTVAAAVLKTKR